MRLKKITDFPPEIPVHQQQVIHWQERFGIPSERMAGLQHPISVLPIPELYHQWIQDTRLIRICELIIRRVRALLHVIPNPSKLVVVPSGQESVGLYLPRKKIKKADLSPLMALPLEKLRKRTGFTLMSVDELMRILFHPLNEDLYQDFGNMRWVVGIPYFPLLPSVPKDLAAELSKVRAILLHLVQIHSGGELSECDKSLGSEPLPVSMRQRCWRQGRLDALQLPEELKMRYKKALLARPDVLTKLEKLKEIQHDIKNAKRESRIAQLFFEIFPNPCPESSTAMRMKGALVDDCMRAQGSLSSLRKKENCLRGDIDMARDSCRTLYRDLEAFGYTDYNLLHLYEDIAESERDVSGPEFEKSCHDEVRLQIERNLRELPEHHPGVMIMRTMLENLSRHPLPHGDDPDEDDQECRVQEIDLNEVALIIARREVWLWDNPSHNSVIERKETLRRLKENLNIVREKLEERKNQERMLGEIHGQLSQCYGQYADGSVQSQDVLKGRISALEQSKRMHEEEISRLRRIISARKKTLERIIQNIPIS